MLTALSAKRPKFPLESEFFSARVDRECFGTLDTKCFYFNDLEQSGRGSPTASVDRPTLAPKQTVQPVIAKDAENLAALLLGGAGVLKD
jgi:hypothetical protein